MSVLIIIPAHNEEKTIGKVIQEAKKHGKVLVIDDCSSDSTGLIAEDNGATVVRHKINRGLGGALRTGFDEATKQGADIIITMDADGQHNPEDIPRFISTINKGYDFVLGSRDLSRYPLKKRVGNFFLNLATNFISGTTLKDTESGFRAFKIEALKKLVLKAKRYEIAVEIVFEVGRNNLKYTNIMIDSPVYVQGVGVLDGFKNFRYLFSRRKRNVRDYLDDFKFVIAHMRPFKRLLSFF